MADNDKDGEGAFAPRRMRTPVPRATDSSPCYSSPRSREVGRRDCASFGYNFQLRCGKGELCTKRLRLGFGRRWRRTFVPRTKSTCQWCRIAVAPRRRCGGVGQIECDLGGAAPPTGPGIPVQDIAGDTNDALDQGLPIGSGHRAGSVQMSGRPLSFGKLRTVLAPPSARK